MQALHHNHAGLVRGNHHHTFKSVLFKRISVRVRAEDKGSAGLSEDVLAQLRQAEAEAAELRKQLAELQNKQEAPKDVVETPKRRIDSTDNRETLFGSGQRTAWLSEADVDFFTGGGVTEAGAPVDPAAQAAVQRRLLIGGIATAGLAAFALIPTKDLRVKPNKPLYFYLVALLRIKEQLAQCQDIIEAADWDQLRMALPRIQGPPGNARQTMYDAVALLPAGQTASQAEEIVGDFVEYLDSMDYNKYFDAMPTAAISGAQNAEFVKFSSASCRSARRKLDEFLALMPRPDLEQAQQQIEAEMAAYAE